MLVPLLCDSSEALGVTPPWSLLALHISSYLFSLSFPLFSLPLLLSLPATIDLPLNYLGAFSLR